VLVDGGVAAASLCAIGREVQLIHISVSGIVEGERTQPSVSHAPHAAVLDLKMPPFAKTHANFAIGGLYLGWTGSTPSTI
jgi:hypothetical protein